MKIIVLDQNLIQKAVLSAWVEFEFHQRINSAGSFKLVLNANDRQIDAIELGQLIYLEPDACGYITRIETVAEKNKANELVEITGIEVKDTMKSRITYPPEGQEAYVYSQQKTDDIAMDLIEKLLVNPIDTRKKVPVFRMGGRSSVGTVIDFSTRLKQLDTEVYSLLEQDKMGLRCTVDLNAKQVYFSVFQGTDRTVSQSVNPRAIFALDFGTLNQAVTVRSAESFKSVGYVGGQGEGTERTILELPNGNALSGLNRWEAFIDLSDAKTETELTSRGNIKLSEYNKLYTVRGDIGLSKKMSYAIGDYVTIKDNKGNYENVQITGLSRQFSETNMEKRALVFGKAQATIAEAVSRRLAGLSNILTK